MQIEWTDERKRRIGAAGGVALVHGLFLLLLLSNPGFRVAAQEEAMKMLDIIELPEPPAEPPPPEKVAKSNVEKPKDPEGAASPANLRNTPTEIVAPVPEIRIPVPPPIPAAPAAGTGSATAAGASNVPGPGTGRGGTGTGLGSGQYGSGTGGGGGGIGRGTRARHISGRIVDSDYPERPYRARIGGTVYITFVVAPTGRVSSCRVTRSSGNRELDVATCRLIMARLVYRPARDGSGRPIAETIRGQQEWEVGPEPEPIEIEPEFVDE